jgi:D-lactate dehydrogenase
MDVMFYEVFAEEEQALKSFLPQNLKVGFTKETVPSLGESPPAPLISIRTQSVIPPSWEKKLSGIQSRSTGFDHLIRFKKKAVCDVPCGYLPAYASRSVAEHAFLLVMALLKKFKKQIKQFDVFNRDGITGIEILGRDLLVVGVGQIGKEMVILGRGMGMKVKGVDLVPTMDDLEYVTLQEGIRNADVILCALPLTDLTQRMLDYTVLCQARRGAIFVNIARGEISPAGDLKKLLEEGILGGIGLDVYEDEARFADGLRGGQGTLSQSAKDILSLKESNQVILTPHNAFNTREALQRKARQSAQSIVSFIKEKTFPVSL